TVREVSGEESRAGLARAAALTGRAVREVRIHISRGAGVTYLPSGRFDFIGLPEDRRANLRLIARVEGDQVRYETGDGCDPWRGGGVRPRLHGAGPRGGCVRTSPPLQQRATGCAPAPAPAAPLARAGVESRT